jgi:hypothetical protein
MHRRFLSPAAVLSLALCGATAHAASTVQLVDPGATPHASLRYQFEAGRTQRATLRTDMQTSLSMGGQQVPTGSVPPMRMTLSLRVAEIRADGTARMEFEVLSAQADGNSPQSAQVNKALAGAAGLAGSYALDQQGRFIGNIIPAGTSQQAGGELLTQLQENLQQMTAPFPEAPVGQGARWRVTTLNSNGGIRLSQTAEYTLRARRGNRIELDMKMVETSVDAGGGLPPGTKLESVKVEGGGSTIVDAAGLVPTGTSAVRTAVTVSGAAGATTQATITLDLKLSVAPTVD